MKEARVIELDRRIRALRVEAEWWDRVGQNGAIVKSAEARVGFYETIIQRRIWA